MKRKLILIIAAALALSSCAKPDVPQESATTRDPNIPDNLVVDISTLPPETAPGQTAPAISETAPTTAETTAGPVSETEPEPTAPLETTADTVQAEPEEPAGPDTRAMDCLRLFNSKKVHAKYIAAACYDGSEIYTTSVEYFVDGDSAIYKTNAVHRYYQGRQITIIDDDNKFYMVYEDDPEPYIYFGYGPENYTLVSESDTEEVYDVESEGVRSTWTFDGDRIKVRDVYADGSFSLYDVEILDSDTSGMDFTVPANYEEVNADDYEFYK